jgi:hypothetical protein
MEAIREQQREMPFFAAVDMREGNSAHLSRMTDSGAMRFAIHESGMDDYEAADSLGISHGYMSKVLHGTAGLYGRRLVRFMQITQSLAPLQWLAMQVGCEVVKRDSRAAEVASLRARLQELERAA